MKRFLLISLVVLVLVLSACATSRSYREAPITKEAYSVAQDYAHRFEATRVAEATRRAIEDSQTISSHCVSWTEAGAHIGESTCVFGVVYSTFKDPNSSAFFINFDDTRASFYGVSFKWIWDDLRGQCVEIHGAIQTYRGRPQIVIEGQDQLGWCRR